jgi:pectinesterase
MPKLRHGPLRTPLALWLLITISSTAFATDYYVDPAGLGDFGNGTRTYTTVQGALNGVPAGTAANPTRILIAPGTYTEQLTVPSNKPYLDLLGRSSDPTKTVLTFNLNATSSNGSGGTSGSASTTINANNFSAANITFNNSTPYGISQAVAVKVQGDEDAFNNCRFEGFQDTLYVANGRDYFTNSYITGSVDFIFGNATAVFNGCTVNTSHNGTITAANTAGNTAIGMVFMNCTVTNTNPGASTGGVQLGRPWQYDRGSYASTFFLNTQMGTQISSQGWSPWDATNTNPAGDTRYGQYGLKTPTNGTFNTAGFVSWSNSLTAAEVAKFTIPNIFGPGSYWDDVEFGIGGSLYGPINAVGTSNVTTAISATSYTNWPLGGTWDPSVQLSTTVVPEPQTFLLLAVGCMALMLTRKIAF